jgi:hypothetical protein
MALNVTENGDGSITIEWNEHDDHEKMYNSWSDEDFLNALTSGILAVAQNNGYDVSGNTTSGDIVEFPVSQEQSAPENGLMEEKKEG